MATLKEELNDIENDLKHIHLKLADLEQKRSNQLAYLSNTDVFIKYKQLTNELVNLRTNINLLESQKETAQRLQHLIECIRSLEEECRDLENQIKNDVKIQNDNPESRFSTIKAFFNDIIKEVLGYGGLLNVKINRQGHLDFNAQILDDGHLTGGDKGHTYRKLLCIAFDMAILRAYLSTKFPRFFYHDGILESLDNRTKRKLLSVIRNYTDIGLQAIITVIDSDLPGKTKEDEPFFKKNEIILTLHDDGDAGRLFKMPEW